MARFDVLATAWVEIGVAPLHIDVVNVEPVRYVVASTKPSDLEAPFSAIVSKADVYGTGKIFIRAMKYSSAVITSPVSAGDTSAIVDEINNLKTTLAATVKTGSRSIADIDAVAANTDVQAVYSTLSGVRTFTLPDLSTYPYGQDFVLADGSGNASETIKILPVAVAGQQIEDGTAIAITYPRQAFRFRKLDETTWKMV